jgi:hypothetical protein
MMSADDIPARIMGTTTPSTTQVTADKMLNDAQFEESVSFEEYDDPPPSQVYATNSSLKSTNRIFSDNGISCEPATRHYPEAIPPLSCCHLSANTFQPAVSSMDPASRPLSAHRSGRCPCLRMLWSWSDLVTAELPQEIHAPSSGNHKLVSNDLDASR